MADYRRLGYSEAWITRRIKTIEIRKGLVADFSKFASEGADVAFTVRKISKTEEDALAEISAFGTKVRMYVADASDFKSAEETAAKVKEEFGRIDVLVNNE